MAIHRDFQLIKDRFTKQFGSEKGIEMFSSWIGKKEFDETKPFPGQKEKKEKTCFVRGVEIKENGKDYHVED